jgi:hypothetical protein
MDVGPGLGSGVLLCVHGGNSNVAVHIQVSTVEELHGPTIVIQQPLRITQPTPYDSLESETYIMFHEQVCEPCAQICVDFEDHIKQTVLHSTTVLTTTAMDQPP